MVIDYLYRTASNGVVEDDAFCEDGWLNRIVSAIFRYPHQFFCGLSGHDFLTRYEANRMSLKCVSCGHESAGWELTEAPPRLTLQGDARKHALVRPQLVTRRAA